MSEYDFEDEGFGLSAEESGQNGKQGNGLRQYLDEISTQLKEMRAENAALKAEKTRADVENTLKAKGYAPAAAGLFTGTPDKLDDWLAANGGALAKLPEGEQGQGEVTPQGPPATTVSATDQAQMQRMQEAGTQGVLPPQGSEAELAQALKNARTPQEFAEIMRANGSQHNWT
ncbi:hypothetical protein [Streptomyces cinereoruber]|uniref:hypothetical protein n=1 Tax=Streptomyces cinereoruber TaxID=67260 RepID=UPI003C2D5078